MEMQQPPTLDYNHPTEARVTSSLFRQQQEQARKDILSNLNAQVQAKDKEQSTVSNKETAGSDTSPQSLSSLYRQAREQKKNIKNNGLGEQAAEAITAPIQQGTSKLLQQYWFNLIDSWGATLILINLHWFLNITLGDKFFCDLGSEWIPKVGKGGAAEQATESILGMPTAGLGLLEKMLVVILDLLVAAIILVALVPVVLAIYIISDPVGALFSDFSLFFQSILAVFKS